MYSRASPPHPPPPTSPGRIAASDIVPLPLHLSVSPSLFPQGIVSAPLYDSQCGGVVGVIGVGDFIHMLRRLKHAVSSTPPLS